MRWIAILLLFTCSCAYEFSNKRNPWKAVGIDKIYVEALRNNSLRAGVEVPFTSALIRSFSRGNKIRVVNSEAEADGTLKGSVDAVTSDASSLTTVPTISQDPAASGLNDFTIATEYRAGATITVSLVRKRDNTTLWTQVFTQTKTYPGNNRFGQQGDTSALINDSELQNALNSIAQTIASDAYDTMLEYF